MGNSNGFRLNEKNPLECVELDLSQRETSPEISLTISLNARSGAEMCRHFLREARRETLYSQARHQEASASAEVAS
jgi:hypothetical protein